MPYKFPVPSAVGGGANPTQTTAAGNLDTQPLAPPPKVARASSARGSVKRLRQI